MVREALCLRWLVVLNGRMPAAILDYTFNFTNIKDQQLMFDWRCFRINLRLFRIIVSISTFFLDSDAKPNYKLGVYFPKAGNLQTYLKVCIVFRSAILKSQTDGCTGVSMSFNHKAHRSPTTVKVRYSNQV